MSKYKCVYNLSRECLSIPQGFKCNEICSMSYQQGRAEAIEEVKELAHEDVTTGNMIISLADVEKLKDNS